MSDLAGASSIIQFLRQRYAEARKAEGNRRRVIPSVFDGHRIEMLYEDGEQQLLVDDHPYPIEKYTEIATESAADPATLADLDAKEQILNSYERWQARADAGEELSQFERGALAEGYSVCRVFAEAEGWQP